MAVFTMLSERQILKRTQDKMPEDVTNPQSGEMKSILEETSNHVDTMSSASLSEHFSSGSSLLEESSHHLSDNGSAGSTTVIGPVKTAPSPSDPVGDDLNIAPKDPISTSLDELIEISEKSNNKQEEAGASLPKFHAEERDVDQDTAADTTTNVAAHVSVVSNSPSSLFDENDVDPCEGESENVGCLTLPALVSIIMRRKRRRLRSAENTYEEAAEQIQLEKDSILNHMDYTKVDTSKPGMRRLLDIAEGDVGLALFMPFNWEAFESLQVDSTTHSYAESSDCDELVIVAEETFESSPPILSQKQMEQIHLKGLPATVRLMTWKRCYSLNRDGDMFKTMFASSSKYQHTLIVIRTTKGDVLGGYADTPWTGTMGSSATLGRSMSFFGGGKAFLFAANFKDAKSNDNIDFYRWTGENAYSQICDLERGALGMGGGGDFGIYVQDDFTKGSSGACDTFGNPPLISDNGGNFDILDFEVYGFLSMSEMMFDSKTRTSTFAKVNSSVDKMISERSMTSLLEPRNIL
jgi:hypothetical protein